MTRRGILGKASVGGGIVDTIKAEPALAAGVLQALLALLLAFGVPLTDEQVGGIIALSAAVLAVVVRQRVTPTTGKHVRQDL